MASESDPWICAVCGRVLQQEQEWVGGRYVTLNVSHGPLDANDHPVVAVRPDELPEGALNMRCDFCFGEPITHTLVVDKELESKELGSRWDTEWAMCQTCTDLVIADRWKDLRVRAFKAFEEMVGHRPHEEVLTAMRVVHRDLRASMLFIYKEA